jgi:3-oxoacyl-[acyl-carrier-protein] synthase III
MPKAKITALGCYVPPRVLTNHDLEKIVETNDQWIVERTGIRERHIADENVATSDMAIAAAKCALAQRGIEASTLDAIIVSISSRRAPGSSTAPPRAQLWWQPAPTAKSW